MKIYFKLVFLTIILFLISLSYQVFSQVKEESDSYGSGWPAAHADGGNTDYSLVIGSRNIELTWQRKFDGTINLGPTSDLNGHLYITTTAKGCHLYALDSKTGNTLWCSDQVNRFAVASSALIDREGNIFIADNEAMHAFDGQGNILWETHIDGFPFSAQFTQTGHVIFVTCIGKIYVLDRHAGEHFLQPVELIPGQKYDVNMDVRACMWGTKDCPCANTPAFDSNTGKFYFTFWPPGSEQAGLMAMRYAEYPIPTITPLWTNGSLPGGSATSPDISLDGSRVYVTDNMGGLHAIDAKTGENIWSFDIGYETGGSQSTSPEGLIMPAGGGNAATMCISDQGDHAKLIWRNDSLLNRGVATQCAGQLAYITVKTKGFENDLVVVDVLTGTEVDREHLPGTTIFTVGTTIGLDGTIYVPSINGYLFAFQPNDSVQK